MARALRDTESIMPRVLLIDDDIELAELATEFLTLEGFEVEVARRAAEHQVTHRAPHEIERLLAASKGAAQRCHKWQGGEIKAPLGRRVHVRHTFGPVYHRASGPSWTDTHAAELGALAPSR